MKHTVPIISLILCLACTALRQPVEPTTAPTTRPIVIKGTFVTIDVTEAPDLEAWARTKLLPICDTWYPKIVEMLPSDGYTAPEHCDIIFKDKTWHGVPAATSGARIECNNPWIRKNLQTEACGAVVHELVHVVQNYGLGRKNNPKATDNPGWMVEGIADHIRWFLFEPESKGAVVRSAERAKYDWSYRTTAAFLEWVTVTHDKTIVREMNAAMREGRYTDELWKQRTGKSAAELGAEWQESFSGKSSPTTRKSG